jgi:hypothetical protein
MFAHISQLLRTQGCRFQNWEYPWTDPTAYNWRTSRSKPSGSRFRCRSFFYLNNRIWYGAVQFYITAINPEIAAPFAAISLIIAAIYGRPAALFIAPIYQCSLIAYAVAGVRHYPTPQTTDTAYIRQSPADGKHHYSDIVSNRIYISHSCMNQERTCSFYSSWGRSFISP